MATPIVPISADEERVRNAMQEEHDHTPLLPVLDLTTAVLERAGVPHLFMGGIASACMGRQRWTHDIDVFVLVEDAARALRALADAGFDTDETFPDWLYKASKDGQPVDLIFRSAGGVCLDEDMLRRAVPSRFMDRSIRTIPAEDMVVIKALVAAEHAPRHWHDALAVLASADLDWPYLMRRARKGIRRVTALLLYAQSCDLPVPTWVVAELFDVLEGR